MGSVLSKRGSSKKSSKKPSKKPRKKPVKESPKKAPKQSAKESSRKPSKESVKKPSKESAAGSSSFEKGQPQKEGYIIKLGLICSRSLSPPRNETCCTWHQRFGYRWTSVDETFLRNPDNADIAQLIRERAHELDKDGRFELRGVFCLAPQGAVNALDLYIHKTDNALTWNPTRTGNLGILMEQLKQGKLRKVEFLPAPPSY